MLGQSQHASALLRGNQKAPLGQWIFADGLALCACAMASGYMGGKEGAAEVQAMIKNGALVVDVRTPGEFSSGHFQGSINIPHTEIAGRLGELGAKDRAIVLYCRSGNRSGIALQILQSSGFTKAVNAGGYSDMPRA